MSYYDELLEKINKLYQEGKNDELRSLILDEFKAPYIPLDIEKRMNEILDDIGYLNERNNDLSDEEINEYLSGSYDQQLIAVSILDKKNLRDYLNECENYLCSDGFINSKVLLIHSLIKQEINEEIKMKDETAEYEFIPKYIMLPEESFGYQIGLKFLEEVFLKDPSMYEIAKQLLYKETILKLPLNIDMEEGLYLGEDIIKYVYQAFNQEEKIQDFLLIKDSIIEKIKGDSYA